MQVAIHEVKPRQFFEFNDTLYYAVCIKVDVTQTPIFLIARKVGYMQDGLYRHPDHECIHYFHLYQIVNVLESTPCQPSPLS